MCLGDRILCRSERMMMINSKGYFFRPTIFKNVMPEMEIAQEEIFGPVAPIITASDENEAIQIANESKFGLGASIWTQDLEKAEKLSSMLEFVNIKSVRFYDQLIYDHHVE